MNSVHVILQKLVEGRVSLLHARGCIQDIVDGAVEQAIFKERARTRACRTGETVAEAIENCKRERLERGG